MSQDLERLQSDQLGVEQVHLSFDWACSFKLLGVILGCNWSFRQHILEMRRKLTKRLQALREVSSTVWALERRILAVKAHALMGSIVCCGLATTRTHVGAIALRRVATLFLNRAARRAAGTDIAMRVETVLFMADIGSALNHYIVKLASA